MRSAERVPWKNWPRITKGEQKITERLCTTDAKDCRSFAPKMPRRDTEFRPRRINEDWNAWSGELHGLRHGLRRQRKIPHRCCSARKLQSSAELERLGIVIVKRPGHMRA